jgi:hypothetical protein
MKPRKFMFALVLIAILVGVGITFYKTVFLQEFIVIEESQE